MDRYEQMSIVGEGSYGVVLKCRHRDSDQIVAIKKFLETEEDVAVRKMALREIRMLKKLKHENLVTMIEVFRHRKRFYLVFEYLEGTVLDELERSAPNGLGDEKCRERIYQVIRAVAYCHFNHIIHRDVKPENILISSLGVVKLCDFGFARLMTQGGEPCTEYVATRWYRAPELLVGEQNYTSAVDVWAIGCLFSEMMTGDPLFPGESDIDQLYLIVKSVGKPCAKHQSMMAKNSQMRGMIRAGSTFINTAMNDYAGLYKTFTAWAPVAIEFVIGCLKMDPMARPMAEDLLRHTYFTHDKFPQRFLPALRDKVNIEFNNNPLLRKFKSDILISTDYNNRVQNKDQERVVLRRSHHNHHNQDGKWRMRVIEASSAGKRKLLNFEEPRKSYRERTGFTFLKSTTKSQLGCLKESELQLLETGVENLSTTEQSQCNEEEDHQVPTTSNGTTNCFKELNNNKNNNKSPKILQSITGSVAKVAMGQMPAIAQKINNNPNNNNNNKNNGNNNNKNNGNNNNNKKQQDLFINIEPLHLGHNMMPLKRKEPKAKEEFSLPNLPGAVSPKNNKSSGLSIGLSGTQQGNKFNSMTPEPKNIIVTPRIVSATSSSKNATSNNLFPFM